MSSLVRARTVATVPLTVQRTHFKYDYGLMMEVIHCRAEAGAGRGQINTNLNDTKRTGVGYSELVNGQVSLFF